MTSIACIAILSVALLTAHSVSAAPQAKPKAADAAKARAMAPEQRDDNATTLVEQANTALANGELDEALALARRATALSPANYKGHYYTGFVLFKMNELDKARAAIQEALQFAPPEARPDLLKLAQTINNTRSGAQAASQAEAAQAEGLNGKAAALWKQAWEADYKNPEHGFAAARAYANTLDQPVAAAVILREIIARSGDASAADKAARVLDQLAPQLTTIASNQFLAAQQASGPARLTLLREALDADPGFTPAYEMRALAAADSGDLAGLKEVLRDMSRRNKLDLSLLKRPEFAKMVRDPGLAVWLDDLVGSVAAKKLLDEVAQGEGQRTRQVRSDGEQKAYQEKLAAYQEQLAQYNKYLPCLEDAQSRQQSCEHALPPLRRGLFGIGSNATVRGAMQAACVRQSKELVAQCQSNYPSDPPRPPPQPAVTAAGL